MRLGPRVGAVRAGRAAAGRSIEFHWGPKSALIRYEVVLGPITNSVYWPNLEPTFCLVLIKRTLGSQLGPQLF